MKTSELLIEAKTRLATSMAEENIKTIFVCHAICPPQLDDNHDPKAVAVARRIENSLYNPSSGGYSTTVREWLRGQGVAACGDIQEYRHLWLDALIAEYEAQGD